MNVCASDSVAAVMQAVEKRTQGRHPAAEMVLCSGSLVLADKLHSSLGAAGVANGTTLRVGRRLRGGGGKKKAKVMPKVVAKEKRHLPSSFTCPFCDHHSVICSM